MDIGVEISMYPLRDEFIPPIAAFIERLNIDERFRVETNSMSTQVFGPAEPLLELVCKQMRVSLAEHGKAVFVLKVLGPYAVVE
ncbi:MAG: hypothetical protein R3E77_04940 [Steroidobacteraceae bacterium]